jgi:hypothetical protein
MAAIAEPAEGLSVNPGGFPALEALDDLPPYDLIHLEEGFFSKTLHGISGEKKAAVAKAELAVDDDEGFGPRTRITWSNKRTDHMSYDNGGCCANEDLFTVREGEELAVWTQWNGRNAWFGAAVAEGAREAIRADWTGTKGLWTRCDEPMVEGPGVTTERPKNIKKNSQVVVHLSYTAGDGTLGTLSVTAEGDPKPFVLCETLPVGCVPFFALWGSESTMVVTKVGFSRGGTYVKAARPR